MHRFHEQLKYFITKELFRKKISTIDKKFELFKEKKQFFSNQMRKTNINNVKF